jgi:hypothetical protein
MKRLRAKGIKFPYHGGGKKYIPPEYEGRTEKIYVSTMEMVLDIPNFSGSYKSVPDSSAGLEYAYRRQRFLAYSLKPMVQFCVRANEAAYFFYGVENDFTDYSGKIAWWMKNRIWRSGRVKKGGALWNIMVLSPDMSLRWRVRCLTQHISAE